jgi:hypothetical protein
VLQEQVDRWIGGKVDRASARAAREATRISLAKGREWLQAALSKGKGT